MTGRDFVDIFRQASHRFRAVRFVLNAVEAHQDTWAGRAAASWFCKAGNRVETDRRKGSACVGESNLNAVGEASERHVHVRMSSGQMFEGLVTGSEDGGLQLRDRTVF